MSLAGNDWVGVIGNASRAPHRFSNADSRMLLVNGAVHSVARRLEEGSVVDIRDQQQQGGLFERNGLLSGREYCRAEVEAEFVVFLFQDRWRAVAYCGIGAFSTLSGIVMYRFRQATAPMVLYFLGLGLWVACVALLYKLRCLYVEAVTKFEKLSEPQHLYMETTPNADVIDGEERRLSSGALSGVTSIFSSKRLDIRSNALLVDYVSSLALAVNSIIAVAYLLSQERCYQIDDPEVIQATCGASFVLDAGVLLMTIGSLYLVPVRFVKYSCLTVLMLALFFSAHFFIRGLAVTAAFFGSKCVILMPSAVAAMILSYRNEQGVRDRFEQYALFNMETTELARLRETVEWAVQQRVPANVVRGKFADVQAVVAVLGVQGFHTWASLRSPCDAVELSIALASLYEDILRTVEWECFHVHSIGDVFGVVAPLMQSKRRCDPEVSDSLENNRAMTASSSSPNHDEDGSSTQKFICMEYFRFVCVALCEAQRTVAHAMRNTIGSTSTRDCDLVPVAAVDVGSVSCQLLTSSKSVYAFGPAHDYATALVQQLRFPAAPLSRRQPQQQKKISVSVSFRFAKCAELPLCGIGECEEVITTAVPIIRGLSGVTERFEVDVVICPENRDSTTCLNSHSRSPFVGSNSSTDPDSAPPTNPLQVGCFSPAMSVVGATLTDAHNKCASRVERSNVGVTTNTPLPSVGKDDGDECRLEAQCPFFAERFAEVHVEQLFEQHVAGLDFTDSTCWSLVVMTAVCVVVACECALYGLWDVASFSCPLPWLIGLAVFTSLVAIVTEFYFEQANRLHAFLLQVAYLVFGLIFVGATLLTKGGNTLGGGWAAWPYLLAFVCLSRPDPFSPLIMWSIEGTLVALYFVGFLFLPRPNTNVRLFDQSLTIAVFIHTFVLRLVQDHSRRERFVNLFKTAAAREAMEDDYKKLQEALEFIAPSGFANNIFSMHHAANDASRGTQRHRSRRLNPLRSNSLGTSASDVFFAVVEVQRRPVLTQLVDPAKVSIVIEAALKGALNSTVTQRWKKSMAKPAGGEDVADRISSVAKEPLQLVRYCGDTAVVGGTTLRETIDPTHFAFCICYFAHIVRSKLKGECQAASRVIASCGPLVGAIFGKRFPWFEFHGPSFSEALLLMSRSGVEYGSAYCTSRVADFLFLLETDFREYFNVSDEVMRLKVRDGGFVHVRSIGDPLLVNNDAYAVLDDGKTKRRKIIIL